MLSIFRKKNSLSKDNQQSSGKGTPPSEVTTTHRTAAPSQNPPSLQTYSAARSGNTLNSAPSMQMSENQEMGGIGIVLQPSRSNSSNMEIMHLFNGGPAQTSGLVAVGDIIKSIDGVAILGMSLEMVVSRLKGPKGTRVELEVLRDGQIVTSHLAAAEYGKPATYQVGEEKTAPVPSDIPVVSSGQISTFPVTLEQSTINSNPMKPAGSTSPKSSIGDAASESERHSTRSIENKKGKRSKESLRTITANPEYSSFSQEELRASYYLEKMTEATSVNPPGYILKSKSVSAQGSTLPPISESSTPKSGSISSPSLQSAAPAPTPVKVLQSSTPASPPINPFAPSAIYRAPSPTSLSTLSNDAVQIGQIAHLESNVPNKVETAASTLSVKHLSDSAAEEEERAAFAAWKEQQERELEEKRLHQESLFAEQMKIAADLEKQQTELLQKQMALEQKEREIQDLISLSSSKSFKADASEIDIPQHERIDDSSKRVPTDEELTEAALAMLPSALDDIRLGPQNSILSESHYSALEKSQRGSEVSEFEERRAANAWNDSTNENESPILPELVSLTLDLEYDQFLSTVARKAAFQNQLKKDIVSALNTDDQRVLIISLHRGSIIADICLMPANGDSNATRDNRTPKVLAYELAAQVSDPLSPLRAAITTKKACRAILRGPPGPHQIVEDNVKISTICSPRGSLSTEISPSKPEIPSRWAVLDRIEKAEEREMSAHFLNNERSKANFPESSLTGSWNYDAVTDGLLPSPSRTQSKSPGRRSSDPLYTSLPPFPDPLHHPSGTSPSQSALSPQLVPSIFSSAGAHSTISTMSLPGAVTQVSSRASFADEPLPLATTDVKVIEALASTGTDLLKRGRYQQARKYLKEALDGSKSLQASGHVVPSDLTFKIFDGLAIVGNLEQDESCTDAERSEKINLWSSNGALKPPRAPPIDGWKFRNYVRRHERSTPPKGDSTIRRHVYGLGDPTTNILHIRSSNPNLYSSADSKQRLSYSYESRIGKEEYGYASDTPLYSSLTSARGSDITHSAANLFATSVLSYTASRSISPSNHLERKKTPLLITSEKEIIALLSNATSILSSKEGRIDRACKYMEQALKSARSLPSVCGGDEWDNLQEILKKEISRSDTSVELAIAIVNRCLASIRNALQGKHGNRSPSLSTDKYSPALTNKPSFRSSLSSISSTKEFSTATDLRQSFLLNGYKISRNETKGGLGDSQAKAIKILRIA
eukprot:754934-Hanusia_phi.AAC.2